MASNNLVPIQLQQGTSLPDLIAYLNQNFRTFADALNPSIMSDGTHNRVQVGKYVHTNGNTYYGFFGFDSDGVLVSYKGVNPVTDSYGEYITPDGVNVLDELLA